MPFHLNAIVLLMIDKQMRIIAVIPARYLATRFPGKPLAEILGKPMIQHVYEQTARCKLIQRVIVATDDKRIFNKVEEFGGEAMMSSSRHISGSDRVAEAAEKVEADIIVNVQGDEPLLNPKMVSQVAELLLEDQSYQVSSLMSPIQSINELLSAQVVKVVTDKQGAALYFSRSPIPYLRSREAAANTIEQMLKQNPNLVKKYFKHIGIYAYRKAFLKLYRRFKPTPLELMESLEQLRILENGYKIKIGKSKFFTIGVDTPEDLAIVADILRDKGKH